MPALFSFLGGMATGVVDRQVRAADELAKKEVADDLALSRIELAETQGQIRYRTELASTELRQIRVQVEALMVGGMKPGHPRLVALENRITQIYSMPVADNTSRTIGDSLGVKGEGGNSFTTDINGEPTTPTEDVLAAKNARDAGRQVIVVN